MRLWHTDLIPVLPRKQLLGQWRELNSIFATQDKHVLINFVYDYPKNDLLCYSIAVIAEMRARGYKVNNEKMKAYFGDEKYSIVAKPFKNKMTDHYLKQCLYNLQEKYDCGIITHDDWIKIRCRFIRYHI